VQWGHGAPSDEALVAALAATGDDRHEALSEVYRRHGGAVWSVAKRVCPTTELAQDVCETVFADLWSRPERFADAAGTTGTTGTAGALRPRLVAEAHTRAVAAARSDEGRRSSTPPSAEVEVAAHAGALSADARRALERLAPVERDAILLTYVGGHTCGQAARLLGVAEDEVKRSVRRGLLNLRRAQDAEGVSR
jgi:RNA polymerase sigma-70 factor (ECF subfamily)